MPLALTIGQVGYNLYSVYTETGIMRWTEVARGLLTIAANLELRTKKIDAGALDDMVSLAKSRVPVDTGRLLNGITGDDYEDYCEFRASAVHETGSQEDYARFVEFGTAAGQRGTTNAVAADEGFYSADPYSTSPFRGRRKLRDRRVYRTHPGTPAEPFFYNSANDILAERRLKMQDVIAEAVTGQGFDYE